MKKKVARKGASKAAPRMPLMALSQVESRELILDDKTLEKLDAYLAKNGGDSNGLTRSDLVAHLLLDKGKNGFKFTAEKNEEKTESLTLPKAAWSIAEKSASKSGNVELSEVVKNLVSEL